MHQLDALAQADDAEAGSGGAQLAVRASRGRPVADDHPDLRFAIADLGEYGRARRVLAGVGERLAHDPVRRAPADGTTIRGTLTVREVCRPAVLSIGQVTPAGQSFTASAAVRVDRTEFGVTAMPGLAGRYLDLTVEVRCTRRTGGTAHA